MPTPWDILELDEETATLRDVKRAYAKRLKVTRPDQDAGAFQELREAFEQAKMELAWASEPMGQVPVDLGDLPPPDSSDHLDPPTESHLAEAPRDPLQARSSEDHSENTNSFFQNEVEAIREAVESEGDVPAAMRSFEGALFSQPAEVNLWGQAFSDLVLEFPDHPDIRLRPEAILFELENEGSQAAHCIISRAESEMDSAKIGNLSQLFQKNLARISTTAGGQAVAHLACAAALWNPMHAKPLMDVAYEILPVVWRDQQMANIERHQLLGSLLQVFPANWRSFWADRIRDPYLDWDWESEESKSALQFVCKNISRSWRGFEMLLDSVPEEVATKIKDQLDRRPTLQTNAMPRPYEATSQPSSGSSNTGCVIAVIVFLAIKALILLTKCSEPSPPNRSGISTEEFQKLKEEGKLITPEELLEDLRKKRENLELPPDLELPDSLKRRLDPSPLEDEEDMNPGGRFEFPKTHPSSPAIPFGGNNR